MTLCEDDAKLTGPVALFLGVETATWKNTDFAQAADFAQAHGITTLFVKVSEVGSKAGDVWYGGWTAWDTIYQELQQRINIIPYAFVYGDQDIQKEIQIAVQMLQKYGKYCLDMEGTRWATPDAAARAKQFSDRLVSLPGKLWVSCPADPVRNNQLPFLQALSPAINIYMPMIYSDNLAAAWEGDFSQVNAQACLQPTFDLSQEFGANNLLEIVGQAKSKGIHAISLWEYQFAQKDPTLLDQVVRAFTGGEQHVSSKHWFEYPICVPYGNPHYDSGLGGSHDMDVQTPPNTPVTALLPGTVETVTSPSWGMSIGIKLDKPYGKYQKQYMAYLHLAAVNVRVGQHVNVGDLLGWSGGCTSAAQYAGTSNPTGHNFLNSPSQSSQPQTGIALMNGPEYGVGAGWVQFPPIIPDNDPTQIIEDARAGVKSAPAPQPQQENKFMDQAAHAIWGAVMNLNASGPVWDKWFADYKAMKFHGPPTKVLTTNDWHGNQITVTICPGGQFEENAAHHIDFYPYH